MPDYRPGLWKIEFTAGDRDADRPREYARQAAVANAMLGVVQAGRCGFAAVGTHEQVIALRDVVMRVGEESFSITRAVPVRSQAGFEFRLKVTEMLVATSALATNAMRPAPVNPNSKVTSSNSYPSTAVRADDTSFEAWFTTRVQSAWTSFAVLETTSFTPPFSECSSTVPQGRSTRPIAMRNVSSLAW